MAEPKAPPAESIAPHPIPIPHSDGSLFSDGTGYANSPDGPLDEPEPAP